MYGGCLMFVDRAEYIIDRGFGKRITKKEALEILLVTELMKVVPWLHFMGILHLGTP